MPTIVVITHRPAGDERAIVWSERVAAEFLDSPHYGSQLLERMRWALEDAEHAERERSRSALGARAAHVAVR